MIPLLKSSGEIDIVKFQVLGIGLREEILGQHLTHLTNLPITYYLSPITYYPSN